MADTSNTYSLNGLNRHKKLSGLHARRPENIEQYFTRTSLNIPPMYVRCLSATINDAGNDQYSYGCYPVFPSAQHPSGIRASGTINLGFTSDSFNITNPGSGYEVGTMLDVTNLDGDFNGALEVKTTGANGSITSVDFIENNIVKTFPLYTTVSNPSNNTATFAIDSGNFKISSIYMNNFGHGYQTFNETTKQTITHSVSISGAGNGSGHDITCSFTPLIDIEIDDSLIPANSNKMYNTETNSPLFSIGYINIIMNDTLTQPSE